MMSPQLFMSYATPIIILIAQQLHNWQSRSQARKTDQKIDDQKVTTGGKLEEIHVLVNGNVAAAQTRIEDLNKQVAMLSAEVARLQAVANVASLSQKITELTAQIQAVKSEKAA
jgi:uncharacterized small protein (DUF1192 family)